MKPIFQNRNDKMKGVVQLEEVEHDVHRFLRNKS